MSLQHCGRRLVRLDLTLERKPQAKTYDGSCAIGPVIVPATEIEPPFTIRMTIERDGTGVYDDTTSTVAMPSGGSLLAYVNGNKELHAITFDGTNDTLLASKVEAVWGLNPER